MADAITSVPAKSSLAAFWWASKNPTPDPTTSFAGKAALITGANAGLGFEAATKFAALGASKLIFGVRSLQRGQEAKSKIEQKTGCKPDVIQFFQLDMGSYSSIETFVHQVTDKLPAIHVAVLNAGIAPTEHKTSSEGWEIALQINLISTIYLGTLLLPLLKNGHAGSGQQSHLEFVSSVGHGDVEADRVKDSKSIIHKVSDQKNLVLLHQYYITKLLETWAMIHIAAKTSSDQVIVNAACPSLCKSNIARDGTFILCVLDKIFKGIFARTAEQGSRVLLSATTTGANAHGGFWSHDRIAV
ncbi:hypothetical protein N7488_005164 [Penicillium malachiteum]|nr:hypothetical protein N7488_005164 [Penicillium malachiteum]